MRDKNIWPYSGEDGMSKNYQNKKEDWVETTEEVYFDQSEAVYPLILKGNYFFVGEMYDFGAYACFVKYQDRFFGKICNPKKFNITYAITEISKQFGME